MKKLKSFFNGSIWATTVLVIVLLANMAIIMGIFQNYIEKESARMVIENVTGLKNDIVRVAENEQEQMEIVRDAISMQEKIEPQKMKNILSSFLKGGMIQELVFLLPDNRILSKDGEYIPNTMGLDVQEERQKGNHISTRKGGTAYQAMVVDGNEAVSGVLYGIINLNKMAELYKQSYFGGHAEIYVLDGKNGNFLMDTWHEEIGDVDKVEINQLHKKYSVEKIEQDLEAGRAGMAVFASMEKGEDVYLYYQPLGMNDWMLVVTVPKSALLSRNHAVYKILGWVAACEVVAVIIYFFWMLQYKLKKNAEKEAELNQVNYMFEIQKALFDVHRKPEHMKAALAKIAERLQADMAFFIVTEKERIGDFYIWYKQGVKPLDYALQFSDIEEGMSRSGSYLLYDVSKIKDTMPKTYQWMRELGIYNIMVSQVSGTAGVEAGILGVSNMQYQWEDARYLECVSMLFFTAYRNIRNQKIIEKMASIDTLTGLLNRNSYEFVLEDYIRKGIQPLACIYIDANGLHEMNNVQGHAAGDEMLCFVAFTLQREFGRENTYRIGGDEFLVFIMDMPEEEIENKIQEVSERIESKGYHIAVGIEYRTEDSGIESVIQRAEKKMYDAKREYYKENNLAERRGNAVL